MYFLLRVMARSWRTLPWSLQWPSIRGRSGFEREGNNCYCAGIHSRCSMPVLLAAFAPGCDQGLGTVILSIFDRQEAADLARNSWKSDLIALISHGLCPPKHPLLLTETRNGSVILSTVILKSEGFPRCFSVEVWTGSATPDPVSIMKNAPSYDVAYTNVIRILPPIRMVLCRK